MAQNITLLGANYSAVPAVTLPKTGGGTARFDDASVTTATASDVATGKVFLASDGTITTGTNSGGSGDGYVWQDQDGYVHLSDEQGTQTVVEPLSVTQNGTYTAEAGHAYSPVTVNVSGSGGSEYELIYSGEVTASTTSTTASTIATITPNKAAHQTEKIVYIKIRDKAGKRNGYFYGSDQWFIDLAKANGSTTLISYTPRILYTIGSDGKFANLNASSGVPASSPSGVCAANIAANGNINIQAKYSSIASGTIDGTYVVDVYYLSWPNDASPLE